jgi:hypothetical protein
LNLPFLLQKNSDAESVAFERMNATLSASNIFIYEAAGSKQPAAIKSVTFSDPTSLS